MKIRYGFLVLHRLYKDNYITHILFAPSFTCTFALDLLLVVPQLCSRLVMNKVFPPRYFSIVLQYSSSSAKG